MQKRVNQKGFTLVELVVVIAVLAILAGVGVVAYNGYIEYANKGKDRALVGEIMHAIELADYADPNLFGDKGVAMVIISKDGAKAYGVSGITEAIEDATPLNSVKLSYDGWGLNAENLRKLLDLISTNLPNLGKDGSYVGYADVANECWDAVKGLAEVYGETEAESVEVVLKVAGMTTGADGLPAWESFDSFDYTSITSDLLIPVRASRLARNFAFAAYLEKNYGSDPEVQEVVKVLTSLTEEEGDNPLASEFDFLTKDASKHGIDEYNNAYPSNKIEWSGYDDAVTAYLNSQAAIDGKAYYTFMNGVYDQYKGNIDDEGHYTGNAKEFWDEASGYISWAAGIGSGQIDVKSMQEALTGATGSNIVINARKKGGNLIVDASPKDASPRVSNESTSNEGCTKEHTPTTYEVSYGSDTTINLCTIEPGYDVCKVSMSGSSVIEKVQVTSGEECVGYTVSVSKHDITFTAKKGGTATVKLIGLETRTGTEEVTITINVHPCD